MVQLFAIEEKEKEKFDVINRDFTRIRLRLVHLNGIFRPLVAALSTFAIALLLYFGGSRILGGTLSFGTLITFTFYAAIFFRPFRSLPSSSTPSSRPWHQLRRSSASWMSPRKCTLPRVRRPGPLSFDIEFDDVHLSYKEARRFSKGSPSPSSKVGLSPWSARPVQERQSITGLVPRFYDVDSGRVSLGHGCRDSSCRIPEPNVAFVMQDVFIFSGSVLDNIALFESTR